MTALDVDGRQRVDHVIDGGEQSGGSFGGVAETTKVQPDHVAFGGKGRPLGAPHPAVGDAGMKEDDRQAVARSGPVVRDSRGRLRWWSQGVPVCEACLPRA